MKNPFAPTITKEEKRFQQDLARWRQMATITGETDQAILKSQPPEVLKLVGPKIEAAFSAKARNSGQLFPIEEKDHAGREVTRYYGDIKAAFSPFMEPTIPIKVSEVTWHKGSPYLRDQLPAWVRVERAMMENGMRPERGAPVG